MTDQEKRELDVKLATHFWGIKKIYYGEWDEDKSWPLYIPSGKPWRTHKIDAKPIPRFTDSLDACFHLLVPKLQDKGHCVTIQSYEQAGYLAFVSESVFAQRGSDGYDPYFKRLSEYEDKDPALALCLVIEMLIDKEE